MLTFLKNCFTGKDNNTPDVGRILWVGSLLSLLGHETYAIGWQHQVFDPVAFSTGCAAILASGGAAIGLKAHTEPGG